MKKILSIMLTLIIGMGIFISVYTPVNAVETSGSLTEFVVTECETTEHQVQETEITRPYVSEFVTAGYETTEENTYNSETTEYEVIVPSTTKPESTQPALLKPAKPTGFMALQDEKGVSLIWDSVDGATSYNIFRKIKGEKKLTLLALVTETTFLDEGVESGVSYEYYVSALNEAVEGDACEAVSIKYVATPRLVSVSNQSKGIKISWSAVAGANNYIVYRKTGSGNWELIETGVKSTFFLDETVKNKSGTTHTYTVRAGIGTTYSSWDKDGIFITRLTTPDITSVQNVVGGITVKWSKVEGAQSYKIYRRVNGGGWKYCATTTKNTYTDKKVSNGKTYKYTAKAVKGKSVSAYENGLSTKYVPTPKLTSVKNTANGLKINWKSVKGATSYKVYRRGAGEKDWNYLGAVKKTTYVDKNVVAYQTYRYTVRAVNGKMSGMDKTGISKKFVPSGIWNKQVTYNFYANAVGKAEDSLPRYTFKGWQNVDYSKTTGDNTAFANEFNAIMKDSFYSASEPLVYKCKKGSSNSDDFLPACDAELSNIKKITASKKGDYITVKIVMKDEVSPENNKGGIMDMSPNYFDLKGTVKGFKKEGLVTSGSASSTYKNFTITAKIKPNGEIVSMKHSCENIKMSMNMNFISGMGNIKYNAQIDSYLTYTNFKY